MESMGESIVSMTQTFEHGRIPAKTVCILIENNEHY